MARYKIKNIARTGSGGTPTSSKKEYYANGNIPWINSGELSQPFISETKNFITELGFKNSSTKIFPKNDTVLLAMYGATAGKASLLQIDACTNQAICAIIPDKTIVEPLFLKYKLDTMYKYLVGLSTGSARDNLSQVGIGNIEIDVPSLEEQQRIASVLSTIDCKIALNRQINANLEALARQLYDYWFVQFDFPNPDTNSRNYGKPYKSSGGKMVYNTQLKREIPEGWENSQMDDMCIMYQPQTLGLNDLAKGGEYLVYGANGTIGNYHAYNHEKSEIAMACRGSSCGTLNRTMPQSWITGNAMVIKLKDEKIHNEYIYHALSYVNISGAITGSGQPQLTRTNIEKLSILKPAKDILLLFSKRVEPIVDLQIKIRTEILSLTRQRDELLPLLMNGQVTIE